MVIGDSDEAASKADWEQRHSSVIDAGGLHIVGTERHESRRIDNQLRGRSGRQGDPGSSRFYLSMEDTLMRIFGDPERTKSLLSRAGMREGEAIESRLLSRQIERAQRKVEAHNFDIRKNLLEYDDVANDQRKVVYHQRAELMDAEEIEESVAAIREEVVTIGVEQYIPAGSLDEMWDADGLSKSLESEYGVQADVSRWIKDDKTLSAEVIAERCVNEVNKAYQNKVSNIGADLMRGVEKQVMLRQLDHHWKEHLAGMDHLRQGIGLRSYAQKNPKQEYKREAFEMFGLMLEQVKHDTISILSRIRIQGEDDLNEMKERKRAPQPMKFQHAQPTALGGQPQGASAAPAAGPTNAPPPQAAPFIRDGRKGGRNEACPCGSGKKFKQCHGKLN
jgi:preprotein translocase subunit SecA